MQFHKSYIITMSIPDAISYKFHYHYVVS
jgi:hypothetical protein